MTFIDWSDSEGMLALLVEFVADERNDCPQDIGRAEFLADLLADLTTLQKQFTAISGMQAIDELRTIHNSIDQAFQDDPVMLHVKACIEELERVNNQSAG